MSRLWFTLRYRLPYMLGHWRCLLFGHAWKNEQYEDHGTGVAESRWIECRRCDGYVETYHFYGAKPRNAACFRPLTCWRLPR